jgi:hypothetical protein
MSATERYFVRVSCGRWNSWRSGPFGRTAARGFVAFAQGQAHALHSVVSLMQQQAQSFRLPLRDLALDGLDADRDLLWRLPHRGTERALQLDAGALARVRLRASLDARAGWQEHRRVEPYDIPRSHRGEMIENRVTGERAVVLRGTAGVGDDGTLAVQLSVCARGAVMGEHVHARITERFRVIDGRLGVRVVRSRSWGPAAT